MRKNSIPGVKIVRAKQADGNAAAYFYHRATGRRLHGEPGSPEFRQVLEEADRQAEADRAPADAVLTISDLVRAYQAAPAWTSLKPSTRETNQFHVAAILRAFKDMTLAEAAQEPARSALLGWHEETRVLALFQLALRLIRQGQDQVPPDLRNYFNDVLSQARSLSQDPRSVQGQILPEAIQLALDIRDLDGLRDDIESAHDVNSVSPVVADRILGRLERRVAP